MDRDRKRSMLDSLPPYYTESIVVSNLLEQEAAELDRLSHAIDDATDQLVINTATWGLDRWEAIFDLPNKKYADLTWDIVTVNGPVFNALDQYTWDGLSEASVVLVPYEDRRSAIRARLRGTGTVTKEMLKNVVESFTNGEVEVIEDNEHYAVTIKFVSNVGIPANYDDAKRAVLEIIPAHIGVEFTNEYSMWQDVGKTTWGNLASYPWADVKGGMWDA
ncbi:putative phage tail protein [Brevibacillus laterosporus]|uniref:putative phage tail protein n=1 Tax=Brevibacillus laterosporus TaxID=1465 RepID=UPI0018F8A449|nr:putative phage tail protein [Brevibacillus laterosporus]MBG9774209.1 hypothetical protein [Brevibacillus laterosporus]